MLTQTPPAEIRELRDQLTKAHADAQEIRSKYEGNKAEMPANDLERWEKAIDDADAISKKLSYAEKDYRVQQMLKESENVPFYGEGGNVSKSEEKSIHEKGWSKYLKGVDKAGLEPEEYKALTLSDPTSAGYLAAPELFIEQLIKDLDNATVVRKLANNITIVDQSSIGAPKLDTDVDDSAWIGENTRVTYSEMAIGKREMKPNFSAKGIKISRPLIMKARMNVESLVSERMAYKFGVTEDQAFLNGSGVNQPLGIFTASDQGISTSRDVDVATNGSVTGDDIMNIFFKLKSGYADRATWIVHRDLLKTLRKLKDSDGNYIWQPFDFPGKQLTGTNPGLIMGRPYETSEYAPKQTNNAWVDAQYLLAFGDFSHYWTLTAMQMEMQVLTELYAEENYIAYIGRMWVDGAPVLEEAFARLVYQS